MAGSFTSQESQRMVGSIGTLIKNRELSGTILVHGLNLGKGCTGSTVKLVPENPP